MYIGGIEFVGPLALCSAKRGSAPKESLLGWGGGEGRGGPKGRPARTHCGPASAGFRVQNAENLKITL